MESAVESRGLKCEYSVFEEPAAWIFFHGFRELREGGGEGSWACCFPRSGEDARTRRCWGAGVSSAAGVGKATKLEGFLDTISGVLRKLGRLPRFFSSCCWIGLTAVPRILSAFDPSRLTFTWAPLDNGYSSDEAAKGCWSQAMLSQFVR